MQFDNDYEEKISNIQTIPLMLNIFQFIKYYEFKSYENIQNLFIFTYYFTYFDRSFNFFFKYSFLKLDPS